jgi:MATE family multidrug resistance protein
MLEQERELLEDSAGVRDYGTVRSSDVGSGSITSPGLPAVFVDESTALLQSSTESRWEDAVDAGMIHTTYWREAKVVAKSAPQLYVTFALQYSLTISSIFAAGRLGKNELAGVSLGSMTATITGYAVYQGPSPRTPTLMAIAYPENQASPRLWILCVRKHMALEIRRWWAFICSGWSAF